MPAGPQRPPSGTVTFVFTDIEGSTRLVDQLGPAWEAGPQPPQANRFAMRSASTGGVEMGTEGDSFFVVFRDAPSAIAAVAEGQLGLASARWPDGADIRVRIGLHTGQARVVAAITSGWTSTGRRGSVPPRMAARS